jgi:hypothetical protein
VQPTSSESGILACNLGREGLAMSGDIFPNVRREIQLFLQHLDAVQLRRL